MMLRKSLLRSLDKQYKHCLNSVLNREPLWLSIFLHRSYNHVPLDYSRYSCKILSNVSLVFKTKKRIYEKFF